MSKGEAAVLRHNAVVGQQLLEHRQRDPVRFQRDLDEHRFLPHRIRNIRMQRGHMGQRDRRLMHCHGGDERQLRRTHEGLLCGHV